LIEVTGGLRVTQLTSRLTATPASSTAHRFIIPAATRRQRAADPAAGSRRYWQSIQLHRSTARSITGGAPVDDVGMRLAGGVDPSPNAITRAQVLAVASRAASGGWIAHLVRGQSQAGLR
jgi:hypothetical protein